MNRLDLDGAEERREEMREKPQRFLTPFAPHSTLENWSAVRWSPLQAELQLLLLLIRKNICCAPKKATKKKTTSLKTEENSKRQHRLTFLSLVVHQWMWTWTRMRHVQLQLEPACFLIRTWPWHASQKKKKIVQPGLRVRVSKLEKIFVCSVIGKNPQRVYKFVILFVVYVKPPHWWCPDPVLLFSFENLQHVSIDLHFKFHNLHDKSTEEDS